MKNRAFSVKMAAVGVAVLMVVSGCLGQIYWKRAITYGENSSDYEANAITPSSDGNFIIAGRAFPRIGAAGLCLLKVNACGDTIWTRIYGQTGSDPNKGDAYAYAITPTEDGNFIAAGYIMPVWDSIESIYLVKIKANGDTIWTKAYRGMNQESATAIAQAGDGDFIVAGYIYSLQGNKNTIYLLKISTNGDTLWTKTFQDGRAYTITPTNDGNFIIAGSCSSNQCLCLLKIKPNGDTLWTRTYSTGTHGYLSCAVTPTQDGNFIVVGSNCVMEINPTGDTLWTRTYDRINDAYAVAATRDGNFIVAGYTMTGITALSDVYLLKIKPNGDTLWTATYGGTGDDQDFALAVAPTEDGNFIVTGFEELVSGLYIMVLSLVDDRYAEKDSLFKFKIPVRDDSANQSCMPIKVPSGMTVNQGDTISWMPQTDSVCKEHVEYQVSGGSGKKDTLTFNVFVNSSNLSTRATPRNLRLPQSGSMAVWNVSSQEVRFSLPLGASSLRIYDILGELQGNIPINKGRANWMPKKANGLYFAKAMCKNGEIVKSFMLVR